MISWFHSQAETLDCRVFAIKHFPVRVEIHLISIFAVNFHVASSFTLNYSMDLLRPMTEESSSRLCFNLIKILWRCAMQLRQEFLKIFSTLWHSFREMKLDKCQGVNVLCTINKFKSSFWTCNRQNCKIERPQIAAHAIF